MRLPGLKTAKGAARRLRSRLRSAGVILGYHRIADSSWDPFELCVSPRHFHEQLEILKHHTHPVALGHLLHSLNKDRHAGRMVAITFDDGYADCLTTCKPLLERFGLPACVFVITGCLGRELWWDQLARILMPSRKLPDELRVTVAGEKHSWSLARFQGRRGRKTLVWDLYRLLVPLTAAERTTLLGELSRSLGVPVDENPQYRCLTREEIALLVADGLIDAGAHTNAHMALDRLSVSEQRTEITSSKAVLEELLGQIVSAFSYPHGLLNAETRNLVKQAGFSHGCGSRPDAVFSESDPFELPRLWVPDLDGARFRRWLQSWVGG